MRLKRPLRLLYASAVLLQTGSAMTACGTSPDPPPQFESGWYDFREAKILDDSCFDATIYPAAIFSTDVEAAVVSTSVVFTPQEFLWHLWPPCDGTWGSGHFAVTGEGVNIVSSACSIRASVAIVGDIPSAGKAATIHTFAVYSGTPDCSAIEPGSQWGPNVFSRFPRLSNPTNGSCSVLIESRLTSLTHRAIPAAVESDERRVFAHPRDSARAG